MDKLIAEVGVRVSPEQKATLDGLAELKGMSTSLLVRQLIEAHIDERRREYNALTELFQEQR